jgi:anti-sigma factor RsiW
MNGKESGKVSGHGPANAEGAASSGTTSGARTDATCDWARAQLSLLLYGELSFDDEEKLESHLEACAECRLALDRETRLHAAFDQVAVEPPASLLNQCRQDLWDKLKDLPPPEPVAPAPTQRTMWWGHELWDRFVDALTLHAEPGSAGKWMRPVGALALVAIGFFAARMAPGLVPMSPAIGEMSLTEPGSAHVRYVEPGSGGQVQIVVDETHQRIVSGRLDDSKIRSLLLAAATDPSDPGLRTETLDILNSLAKVDHVPASDVRDTLVFALRHDQNAGVRLKAMEGLKPLARDPEVRAALTSALLNDENPGVRTQAIDALTAGPGLSADRDIVGTLQELMLHENNAYVRDRGRLVLESLKASPETY